MPNETMVLGGRSAADLDPYWMPFTVNSSFKKKPRIITKVKSSKTKLISRGKGYHGVNFRGMSVGGIGAIRNFGGGLDVDHLAHTRAAVYGAKSTDRSGDRSCRRCDQCARRSSARKRFRVRAITHWIGGKARYSQAERSSPVWNPATGERQATARRSSCPSSRVTGAEILREPIARIGANPRNGTAILTSNGEAARELQRSVKVEMIGINVPIPPMAYYSFAGWKASLFGDKDVHVEKVSSYTRTKVVMLRWPDVETAGGATYHFPSAGRGAGCETVEK